MGKIKDYGNGVLKDIEEPIPEHWQEMFRKGKLKGIIIYEDGSYAEMFLNHNKSYKIAIKERDYYIFPHCIIKGKHPTIMWFFNNPFPINLSYQNSRLKAIDFYKVVPGAIDRLEKLKKDNPILYESIINTELDAKALHMAFSSNLISGIYAKQGMTVKSLLIIGAAVLIAVLVLLQVTGQVDVVGGLTKIFTGGAK